MMIFEQYDSSQSCFIKILCSRSVTDKLKCLTLCAPTHATQGKNNIYLHHYGVSSAFFLLKALDHRLFVVSNQAFI